jgi:hypothetical protein
MIALLFHMASRSNPLRWYLQSIVHQPLTKIEILLTIIKAIDKTPNV